MHTRFIHAADIHLGYEQYGLAARANDFARAFLEVVQYAVQVHADFVLLAGDLFNRASADAWMLAQATEGLRILRDQGIPVVAVEGNHDAQHARKHLSWMEYLCDRELLILLNVTIHPNQYKELRPWEADSGRGAWIDIAGVRIYGLKHYGAITSRILEDVRDQFEPSPNGYTVLMLHAGIQGQVPHVHGGLTPADLAPLHPPIDYLALGHVHKRLQGDDGWIYNPGSTETNSMEEINWPHGFFDVQVDLAAPHKHHVVAVDPEVRPFRRISVSADGVGTVDQFVSLVEETIAAHPPIPEQAVIELYLGGTAEFRRQDIPLDRLNGAIEVRFAPLVSRVRSSVVGPGMVSVRHSERFRRSDLERTVIEQLVHQHGEYRERSAQWTKLILDVKNMAAEHDLPTNIVDSVQKVMAPSAPEAETVTAPSALSVDPRRNEPISVVPDAFFTDDDDREPAGRVSLFEEW